MKLVDILARELDVWPDQYDCLSQMRHDGGIINGRGFDGVILDRLELAEDSLPAGVIVTKAQWQAAVDALKADEIDYSAENVSVNSDYATHISSPINAECKIVQPEWNGDGLPPVGSYLEVHDQEDWRGKRAKVIHNFESQIGDDMVVVESDEDSSCACFNIFSLRPIRTPEQIAAEDREWLQQYLSR